MNNKVKYVVKSTRESGALLKFDSKIIIFDTEDEAKEECDKMNAFPNVSVISVPVDEDVLLSLLWYAPVPIIINNKSVKEKEK